MTINQADIFLLDMLNILVGMIDTIRMLCDVDCLARPSPTQAVHRLRAMECDGVMRCPSVSAKFTAGSEYWLGIFCKNLVTQVDQIFF